MDTPDKNRIATVSLRTFEDSPVFKYISNLSPIEPAKPILTDHVLNSLALASPSSIFKSPPVNYLRESRFSIKRHPSPDVSYSGLYHCGTANATADVKEGVRIPYPCFKRVEWGTPRRLDEEVKPDSPAKQPDAAIELPEALKKSFNDCDFQMVSWDEVTIIVGNETGRNRSIIKSKEDHLKLNHDPVELDIDSPVNCQEEENELHHMPDVAELISDVADLLDNKGQNQKPADPKAGVAPDILFNDAPNHLALDDSKLKTEGKEERRAQTNKRSVRRRCLVFDAGSFRQKPACGLADSSSTSLTSNLVVPSPEKGLVQKNMCSDNPSSKQHGVGLHLNGLVSTSNNRSSFKSIASHCLSDPSTMSNQNPNDETLTPISTKEDFVAYANEVIEKAAEMVTDGEILDSDELMGKRNWSDHLGESGSCKRCNCRRSKCLKLYCDCFAAGLYCIEPCSCQDCFNKPIHEDIVLSTRQQIEARNPLAFASKVVTSTDSTSDFREENNTTPASARHKRGCNCKRSSCLKKYCECFQMGVGCSPSCRCQGCKNTYGCKDEPDELNVNEEEPEDCRRHEAIRMNSQDDAATINESLESATSMISREEHRPSNISQDRSQFISKLQTIPETRTSEIVDTQMLILRSIPLFPSLKLP